MEMLTGRADSNETKFHPQQGHFQVAKCRTESRMLKQILTRPRDIASSSMSQSLWTQVNDSYESPKIS